MANEKPDPDERFVIEGDPEGALRGLLNTEPESTKRQSHRCPKCRGNGRLPGMVKTTGMGKGMGSAFGPCPACDGTGYISE